LKRTPFFIASRLICRTLICSALICLLTTAVFCQTPSAPESEAPNQNQTNPPAQQPAANQTAPPAKSSTAELPDAPGHAAAQPEVPISKQQPKRILGIMPNYRAVSAGAIPPPPTPKEAFKIATQNSFDYSSFIFVGITSLMAEGTDAHPQLGKGVAGYGRYYWRGFVDKTDGNYLVIFALPSVLHQDERYYAKGEGAIWKRGIYAASRILITPDYHGHNTFNASEIFGRAIAQGISTSYYPSHDRTGGALAVKYGYAMGRDALTQTFREFWPDIATHVLHRHP
jgi:subtilisin family serine protease